MCVLPLLEREVEYVPYILSINCRVNTIFTMTCNIMTPFLTLSISMLVPTLCDCFSSSTFPDDSGNLQSRTKALGTLLQKVLGRFPIPTPFPHHPSSLHKKRCTHNLYPEVFSEFQLCIGWGEGELQENFKKETLFNEGTQKLQEVLNIALLSQGLFVHDCSFY